MSRNINIKIKNRVSLFVLTCGGNPLPSTVKTWTWRESRVGASIINHRLHVNNVSFSLISDDEHHSPPWSASRCQVHLERDSFVPSPNALLNTHTHTQLTAAFPSPCHANWIQQPANTSHAALAKSVLKAQQAKLIGRAEGRPRCRQGACPAHQTRVVLIQ